MIKDLLTEGKSKLLAANINEVDGEILLAHLLGLSRMELHNPLKLEAALKLIDFEEIQELYLNFIERRVSNEPTQYITGTAYFRELELSVGPGVLIPRPETEGVVTFALNQIKDQQGEISVIDLGSGSGAIALAIATENPSTRVIAVENSDAALFWLKENVAKYVPDLRVVEGDVSEVLEGVKADLVLTNPPYVPNSTSLPLDVFNHEPHSALFGGESGLEIPKNFIEAAARLLKTGGLLVIEHGEEHEVGIYELLKSDFDTIKLHFDLNNRPRFTSARRKS